MESASASDRQAGTVKWYDDAKGYGFIVPDAGGADVFFHHSEIKSVGKRTLDDGDRVDFVVEHDQRGRGPRARHLRTIGD